MNDLGLEMRITKKITAAQFAFCSECDQYLGNQYWSLSKSVHMHKGGTGHDVTLLVYKDAK